MTHYNLTYIVISADNKSVIHHTKKSLLFINKETLIIKESGLFDVSTGIYDITEACDTGLYRENNLNVFKNESRPQSGKKKKKKKKKTRKISKLYFINMS